MQFRLLGPLEVVDDAGQGVPLGPPRHRALLAALCLHLGTRLSPDRLIDLLWGEQAPPTAQTILHGSVAGLRKVLEPGRKRGQSSQLLVLLPDGYALEVEPRSVDVLAFEQLLYEGRARMAGDTEGAERMLSQALAVWRGPALQGIAADFAVAAAARLNEFRLNAIEARAETRLALGRHQEVATELEVLASEHPLPRAVVGDSHGGALPFGSGSRRAPPVRGPADASRRRARRRTPLRRSGPFTKRSSGAKKSDL